MTEYIVPDWCRMPLGYHNDGMGGCWGISYGYVVTKGENYCKHCEYYEPNLKKHDTPTLFTLNKGVDDA